MFDKKSARCVIERKATPNQQLPKELHKSIIRNFEIRKLYSSFKDNTWGVDIVEMQLISKFNKGIRFLLYVSIIFSKCI